jgi:murein DD-endopeptidase MepM/ murein hydrolase activator NlpD
MKISLFYKSYIIKASSFFIMVSLVAGTPLMVDASFISDIFNGNQAQADEIVTIINENSQTVDLLGTESVNPDIKNAEPLADPIIEQGGSFIYNDGLSEIDVSSLGLEKSSLSDQIMIYVVKEGDTLSEIAEIFNVSANTIRCENNISGQTISVGQKLNILPMTGVKHTVKSGDTLSKIADKYEAEAEDIKIFNDIIDGEILKAGDIIFVPNGIIKPVVVVSRPSSGAGKVVVSNTKVPSGYYIRPASGIITSPYGSRRRGFHPGVDIGNVRGTTISSAAEGVVVVAVRGCTEGKRSCGGGYGNHIDILHPNGTITRYGHLRSVSVNIGQTVTQGEKIGEMGNTGISTGPHLHFEVINANGSKMRPPV